MFATIKKAWIPLTVAAAVVLGGVAVEKLRGAFGSEPIFSATGSSARPLEPTHVKRVTYEVYGPGEATGSVSYLDKNAQPERANFTSLPWIYEITTTVPAVIANLVAQGDGDRIGCRITVNGEVKDEQSAAGRHAQTSCLVKAA